MNVGTLRQRCRVDLRNRHDHHDIQVRPAISQRGHETDVHALVDDTEEADARRGNRYLIAWVHTSLTRVRKVREVDR